SPDFPSKMASSPSPPAGQIFVDIHTVLRDDNDGIASLRDGQQPIRAGAAGGGSSGEARKPMPLLVRQISLESGIAVLDTGKEVKRASSGKAKADNRVLSRNGKSLGGLSATGGDAAHRKGDFNIFRTKSTLGSRQNSLLPSRRENRPDLHCANGAPGSAGMGDRVTDSVPAGRYFAALRGPELDQVRVIKSNP
ncbi:hypothetical protein GW17_00062314, partial [Ensete ventricosum]